MAAAADNGAALVHKAGEMRNYGSLIDGGARGVGCIAEP